ncbi:MAG: MgtC/SapB family protein [Cyclobacteriaceae bacterium]|nr:MgtC/SapB family protein [Cyclobacteriaceae bacterium]
MTSDLFINLILAFIFGATVGLERESSKGSGPHVGGIRTFSLMSMSGALAGIFIVHGYLVLGVAVIVGFLLLLISNYITEGLHSKDFGITSELSALGTFFLGLMVMLNIIPLQTTVAFLVILVFILSLKSRTEKLMAGISKTEVQSFVSYAIIALVALPVLPDYAYKVKDLPIVESLLRGLGVSLVQFDNLDLINPRKIWFVVVLITGIDVFGYILSRLVGDKSSFALTSFMAGFVSSTSTTQSLALRSKSSRFVNHLVGAAILANLASFFQIFLLIGPLNAPWLMSILPSIMIMILAAAVLAVYYFKRQEPDDGNAAAEEKKSEQIFSLLPALKFAALLIVIKIVTKICLILFGESGFIISSVLASFAGIDAIMVNLADMAGHTITFKFAFLTFLIINATNLLSKSGYSYLQGDRRFALRFLMAMLIVIGASATGLLFF